MRKFRQIRGRFLNSPLLHSRCISSNSPAAGVYKGLSTPPLLLPIASECIFLFSFLSKLLKHIYPRSTHMLTNLYLLDLRLLHPFNPRDDLVAEEEVGILEAGTGVH